MKPIVKEASEVNMEISISSFDGKNSWEKVVSGPDIATLKESFARVVKSMAETFSIKGRFFLEMFFTEDGEYLDSDSSEIIIKSNGDFVIEM